MFKRIKKFFYNSFDDPLMKMATRMYLTLAIPIIPITLFFTIYNAITTGSLTNWPPIAVAVIAVSGISAGISKGASAILTTLDILSFEKQDNVYLYKALFNYTESK